MTAGGKERPCEVCKGGDFTRRFEKAKHRYERCDACGLERIHPHPSDAELARIYAEDYYAAWGLTEDVESVRALKQATFRRVVAAAGTQPRGAKVLDCGAATGFLMEVAAEASYEPYGVELSSFGAGAIGSRFGSDHVFEGQLEQACFPQLGPAAFSAIFMCDYLEHVRDPARVLGVAAQWLQPGAPLVITTPRVGSFTQRAMGAGWSHYKTEHLYYFTADSMQRLLAQAGFVDVRSGPMWKAMSIDYVRHYFAVYRHPVFSILARLLGWLPSRLRGRHLPLLMGEMLVVARRDARTGMQESGQPTVPISSRA